MSPSDFKLIPQRQRISLAEMFFAPEDMRLRIAKALILVIRYQHSLTRRIRSRHMLSVKSVDRDERRCKILMSSLKRLACIATGSSTCPMQLGFSDMSEWIDSNDPCRRTGAGMLLPSVISRQCTCGRIDFTRRNHGLGDRISENDWIGILVHHMKNNCVVRFFSGNVIITGFDVVRSKEVVKIDDVDMDNVADGSDITSRTQRVYVVER